MLYKELQAELSCLNLNMYASPMAGGYTEKQAVLVWIHGGAFTYSDTTHDYCMIQIFCIQAPDGKA